MAKFEVTTSELKRAISDLTADNSEFKSRVSELQEQQQEPKETGSSACSKLSNT